MSSNWQSTGLNEEAKLVEIEKMGKNLTQSNLKAQYSAQNGKKISFTKGEKKQKCFTFRNS